MLARLSAALRQTAAIGLTATAIASAVRAGEPASPDSYHVQATIELTDGSRLIGVPADAPLNITLDYGQLAIPLAKVTQWRAAPSDGRPSRENAASGKIIVQLKNGDQLTGAFAQTEFPVDTILGRLSPELKHIRSVSYRAWREGNMPPGDGPLSFCGLNWLPWHTEFAIDGDKLKSLPKARAGFQYGHEGHGRGPMLMANIGDERWRDYSLDVQLCAAGVDPSFNPYGLGSDYYDASIMFHITDAKESFNERGSSFYIMGFHGSTGTWELRAVYNSYCNQPMGWGNPKTEAERTLAQGSGLKIDRASGNRIRIDVVGNRIQGWFEDSKLFDVVDDKMSEEIGGQRLDHGGIGFGGGFDAMIWLKDVTVRALAPSADQRSAQDQESTQQQSSVPNQQSTQERTSDQSQQSSQQQEVANLLRKLVEQSNPPTHIIQIDDFRPDSHRQSPDSVNAAQ